jgi:[acyl-carrier-protein] S-malonyltransferase
MAEAKVELAEAIAGRTFRDPVKVVYSNVTGGPIRTGEEAKRLCAEQVVSTVRWVDVEASILADSYEAHLEVGPGNVLAGLWKRFQRGLRCQTAGKLAEIQGIKESGNNA